MNRYERFADVLKRKELGEGIRVSAERKGVKDLRGDFMGSIALIDYQVKSQY